MKRMEEKGIVKELKENREEEMKKAKKEEKPRKTEDCSLHYAFKQIRTYLSLSTRKPIDLNFVEKKEAHISYVMFVPSQVLNELN